MRRALTTWIPLTGLLFALGACGGRTLTGAGNNNNVNPGGECQAPADCVIARKWDACCACPVPASAEDLAADPCLIPVGQSNVPDGCFVDCPAIPCEVCPDEGKSLDCDNGECTWAEGHCTQDTECVPVLRTDNCCEVAFPGTHADVAADPCLTYWPIGWSEIPQQCYDQWPELCDLVDCAPVQPSSRAMYCSSDGCAFADECEQTSDCTLMVDHRQCCFCPEAWPVSMIGHDPCIVPLGEIPAEGCYLEACLGVMCEECPPNPVPDCALGGTCTGVWAQYQ